MTVKVPILSINETIEAEFSGNRIDRNLHILHRLARVSQPADETGCPAADQLSVSTRRGVDRDGS